MSNKVLPPIVPNFLSLPLKLLLLIPLLFSFLPLILCILLCFLIRPFSKLYANKLATLGAAIQWSIYHCILRSSSTISIPHIPKDNYLVISNHLTAFDFTLINAVNSHMFPHSKYAFKDTLKFIPIIYQAFLALNCLILKRNFEKDKETITKYARMVKANRLPIWFVLFCEGTRFTAEKKVSSDAFCKERGMEPFRNVLSPRYKGFDLLRKELGGTHVRKVLDLTFYCKQEGVSAVEFIFGWKQYEFICDARVIEIKEIEDSEEFIIEAFRRKDLMIDSWRLASKKD